MIEWIDGKFIFFFRHYGNDANAEKFAVFALRMCDLNPGPKMYDLLVRDKLKRVGLNPPKQDLEAKWSTRCWKCEMVKEDKEALKTCTGCRWARYCGRECQAGDWRVHKLLHREVELTKQVLAQGEEEGEEEES